MTPLKFEFCGSAYTAANPDQDAQELINWFLERSQDADSKVPNALLGAPGLRQRASTTAAPVRGAWVLPGGLTALVVAGASVYLVTVTSPPTATTRAVYATQLVGTISTSVGPVVIRYNGPGGVAVVVDGSTHLGVYKVASRSLSVIDDDAFLGATHVTFANGWLTFNKPKSQTHFTSPLYWDGVAPFDGSFFASKDSSTDQLVAIIESLQENWLLGERTTEIWYLNPDNP